LIPDEVARRLGIYPYKADGSQWTEAEWAEFVERTATYNLTRAELTEKVRLALDDIGTTQLDQLCWDRNDEAERFERLAAAIVERMVR
jgi:hypothetical protein